MEDTILSTFEFDGEKYKPYFGDFEWPWYMPAKWDYEKNLTAAGFT